MVGLIFSGFFPAGVAQPINIRLYCWNLNNITVVFDMHSEDSALAIPFISYVENEGFSLSAEAEEFLNSLSENR